MIDRKIRDVQISYDVVADEYVQRVFEELEHKPLDRRLLDRFAARVQAIGTACDRGCGPAHVARYLQIGLLGSAGFQVGEIVEREPYPGVDRQSRRAYIFAEKPPGTN